MTKTIRVVTQEEIQAKIEKLEDRIASVNREAEKVGDGIKALINDFATQGEHQNSENVHAYTDKLDVHVEELKELFKAKKRYLIRLEVSHDIMAIILQSEEGKGGNDSED